MGDGERVKRLGRKGRKVGRDRVGRRGGKGG